MRTLATIVLWTPVMLTGLAILIAPFWIVYAVGLAESHPVIAFLVAWAVAVWLCSLGDWLVERF